MSTTFISHRMFVAALNHDQPAPVASPGHPQPAESPGRSALGAANPLTVEQLAAFAARYWPELPFASGWKQSAS